MPKQSFIYRNARSGELLELFLVASISSVLLTRFFLHLSGYPSIGGSLHIAHMLYGGAFMTAAIIMLLGFLGMRLQRVASVTAGIGFGLFIDELGKFITRDNNYFFQPTIALMYLVFIGLFLTIRSITRTRSLSEREYLLNAVMIMEEVVIEDLEEAERGRALFYLDHAKPGHPLVKPLRQVLLSVRPEPDDPEDFLTATVKSIEKIYERTLSSRWGVTAIDVIFILSAVIFLVDAGAGVIDAVINHTVGQHAAASILSGISSAVSAGFVLTGAAYIKSNRLKAYGWFRRSLLVNILVTQFFAFYLKQFAALPGFILNIALYITLLVLIRHERRNAYRSHIAGR